MGREVGTGGELGRGQGQSQSPGTRVVKTSLILMTSKLLQNIAVYVRGLFSMVPHVYVLLLMPSSKPLQHTCKCFCYCFCAMTNRAPMT